MKNIYELRFYDFLTRIADLIIANLLFIIGALPIITAGVSMRALYCTILKNNTEGYSVSRVFFSAYRDKFWQVLSCSVTFAVTVVFLLADLVFFAQFRESIFAEVCTGLIVAAGIVVLFAGAYCFPLSAVNNFTIREAVINSFVLSMRYLPRSVLICVLNILPIMLAYFWTYILLVILPVWICIGFALTAYINIGLMRPAFDDIKNKENDAGESHG